MVQAILKMFSSPKNEKKVKISRLETRLLMKRNKDRRLKATRKLLST